MCCYTHDAPVVDGYGGQVAGREEFRCRCGYGGLQCVRQATQEDRLCARCRADEPGPPASFGGPPASFGGPDFYAAGRVGEMAFASPLRYERALAGYRILPSVVSPPSVIVATGLG